MFDAARALAVQPIPETDGVGIVSNAGGLGVLTTDALMETTLNLARLSGETKASLADVLPDSARPTNPLDIIGDVDVERLANSLDAVLADPDVGSAIVLSAPSSLLDYEELAREIAEQHRATGIPVLTCLMGGERVRLAEHILRGTGIPNYPTRLGRYGGLRP